ncbi:MurR/RpiR family transcriptional regulator [Streptococcus hongkongensis]|nr:RpiR family transcriptional regulator [Streptococcus uberis]
MTKNIQIKAKIEDAFSQMTPLEISIGKFFINNDLDEAHMSSRLVVQRLHVSQAALTRFAKKCGYSGYRSFAFDYLQTLQTAGNTFQDISRDVTKRVLVDYDTLINKTYSLVDEEKLQSLAEEIDQAERIYFYGKGSSALVAQEMKLRFMRLGIICDAYSDTDGFTWANSLVNKNCLVIGFSLSGQTLSVIKALEKAAANGAKTKLITTRDSEQFNAEIDVFNVSSTHQLNYGNRVSPQFPLLIMMDIIYAYVLEIDRDKKEDIFEKTIIN